MRIEARPLAARCEAPAAGRVHVERVHTPAYVDELERLRGFSRAYEARSVLPGSMQQIYMSAGSVLTAVTRVCTGSARRGFALCEPPGHHAEADRSMGFCALNNVAIAAAFLRADLGFERILIVDWDVHHGNGTQHAFDGTPGVLFFDIHQSPHFPSSGHADEVGIDRGRGYTINVPLPPGMRDADYLAVVEQILRPASEAYRPDFVLVSAGFDPHRAESLGDMQLTAGGFARLCAAARDIADTHAEGRLVLALEGGYNPEAVGESAAACLEVLDCATTPCFDAADEPPSEPCRKAIAEVRRIHSGLGVW